MLIIENLIAKKYKSATKELLGILESKMCAAVALARTKVFEDFDDDYNEDGEPFAPDEEDITTPDGNVFYYLGRQIAHGEVELKSWMKTHNWYPNVWMISDHGNAHLMTLDEATTSTCSDCGKPIIGGYKPCKNCGSTKGMGPAPMAEDKEGDKKAASLYARGARPFGDPSLFSKTMPDLTDDEAKALDQSHKDRAAQWQRERARQMETEDKEHRDIHADRLKTGRQEIRDVGDDTHSFNKGYLDAVKKNGKPGFLKKDAPEKLKEASLESFRQKKFAQWGKA